MFIWSEDAAMTTGGNGLTNTVMDSEAEQPPAFEPVTVYVVVITGLTEIEADADPVLQKKLEAPLAVRVVKVPAQITV